MALVPCWVSEEEQSGPVGGTFAATCAIASGIMVHRCGQIDRGILDAILGSEEGFRIELLFWEHHVKSPTMQKEKSGLYGLVDDADLHDSDSMQYVTVSANARERRRKKESGRTHGFLS